MEHFEAEMEKARASMVGLNRGSCVWRDAIGPGFAIGVTEETLRVTARFGSLGYCAE